MSDWETKVLSDLVIDPITYGIVQPGDFSKNGVPLIRGKDYMQGWAGEGDLYRVTPELHEKYKRSKVTKGDLLLSIAGYVGEVAIVPEWIEEANITQTTARIRCNEEILASKYLLYFLQSNEGREITKKFSKGSAQSGLNLADIAKFEIPLPPLPEQKKIAEILSGIDNLVRSLTEHNQKLEATKTALSKELISGHSGHRKESPYGQIPEHWIESTLGGIIGMANLQTGPFGSQLHAHEYTTEGIPVVMPQDMRKCGVVTDKIARITPDRAQTLEKHKVSPGDILFSRRGDIGRHAIISTNESGWICGTGCLRARTDGAINPIFLSELLRHKYALEWLNANAVGQTMLNLNTGILADLPVVVPPADEQEKIANSLSSINEQTRKIANKIWHTQNLKAAVASDLLSGRKRVSI